jgi:hypothetical protein
MKNILALAMRILPNKKVEMKQATDKMDEISETANLL